MDLALDQLFLRSKAFGGRGGTIIPSFLLKFFDKAAMNKGPEQVPKKLLFSKVARSSTVDHVPVITEKIS